MAKILIKMKKVFLFLTFILISFELVNAQNKIIKPNPSEWKNDEVTIAWIGHSTVLINFYGVWILTDPVLFERVGVYVFGSNIGPSRITPPALTIDEIPQPDIVLISHAHFDHMDTWTLTELTEKYPDAITVITAYKTKDIISDLEWKEIIELDWGETIIVKDISFSAYEVKHWGARIPVEKDRSKGYFKDGRSYNSYVISKKNKKVLFGGDTGFTDKFNILKDLKINVAIMPIGAYNPWKYAHCNPEEALIMTKNMNVNKIIPIHTMTFPQGEESFREPIEWLMKSATNYNIEVVIKNIGETYIVK
ncbi:MAG: MBL fold metallo-hydrolase [Ignavibacteriales bacterium]|nr:MBL fold metallo-hydrolase [Ignavibacteriales bacterium]